MRRIENLLNIIEKGKLDGLLLVKDSNIRYISGFTGSQSLVLNYKSYVVISPKGRAFITNSNCTEQAEQECPDFEVIRWRLPFPELQETLKRVCEGFGIKRLGFE